MPFGAFAELHPRAVRALRACAARFDVPITMPVCACLLNPLSPTAIPNTLARARCSLLPLPLRGAAFVFFLLNVAPAWVRFAFLLRAHFCLPIFILFSNPTGWTVLGLLLGRRPYILCTSMYI